MRLAKIEISNFKLFGRDFEMDLPTDKGLYLLTGENLKDPANGTNAIGKSSLLDAICWCLYKKTVKKKDAGTLRNRKAKGGYAVALTFEQEDGTRNRLVRTWNPNQLQLDIKDIKEEEVVDFIGLTYDQFLCSTLFPQASKHITPFIEMTASAKLAFLSNLFELDRWLVYADKAKELAKETTAKIRNYETNIESLNQSIESDLALIEDLQDKESSWHEKQATRVQELQEEAEKLKALVQDPLDLEDLKAQVKTIRGNERLKLEQLRDADKAINDKTYEIKTLKKTIDSTKDRVNELATAVENLDENPICPTCQQEVDTGHVHELSDQWMSEAEKLIGGLPVLDKDIRQLEAQIEELQLIKVELQEELETIQNELVQTSSQLNNLESENQAILKNIDWYRKAQAQVEAAQEESNPFTDMVERAVNQLTEKQARLEQWQAELTEAHKQEADYLYWQKKFPLVRLAILQEIIDELEIHFNQALGLLGLVNWTIKVSTEKQLKNDSTKNELTITVNTGDNEEDIDELSGGELQRARICLDFGLSELIKSRSGKKALNLMLFDEPCAHVSQIGIEYLLSMLENLGEYFTVMVAEHRVFDMGHFQGVYNLVREEDGNTLLRAS